MSSQYKYTREELEKVVETKSTAKKFTVGQKGNEFFIGNKKVIPVEGHLEFLNYITIIWRPECPICKNFT
jgi:hypothetical protein